MPTRFLSTLPLTLGACLLTLLGSGCVEQDSDPDTSTTTQAQPLTAAEICDGSDDIRIANAYKGGGPVEPGREHLSADGFHYFYLDGHCRYWVLPAGENALLATHTGELSDVEVEALGQKLELHLWEQYATATVTPHQIADAGASSLHFGDVAISCPTNCDRSNYEAQVKAIQNTLHEEMKSLHTQGTPLDGPVRVMGVRQELHDQTYMWPVATWDLSMSVNDVIVPLEETASHPPFELTGEDALKIRDLRTQTMQGDYQPEWQRTHITIQDQPDSIVNLFVRDVLPFQYP